MATLQPSRDGKSWVLSWTPPNGKRRRTRIGRLDTMSKREAGLILRAKELELATGQPMRALRSSAAVRFEQLAKRYVEWHSRTYTASHGYVKHNVEQRLVPAFGKHVLEDIDVELIERYLTERTESGESKPATIVKELNTLKAMIKKAIEWKLITHDAVRKIKNPENLDSKPKHFYTPAELQRIYAVASPYTQAWRLIVNTGMRRAEALALTRENTANGTVNILSSAASRTKSKKWRAVPIGPGARAALDTMPKKGYLLPRITGHSLSRAFLVDRGRAGLKVGTLHSLRHTFITQLILNGKPLRVVQVLAGHSSIAVTEGYAHVSEHYLEGATRDLDL